MLNKQVDAVVTWVDGRSPSFRLEREEAMKSSSRSIYALSAGVNETRFSNSGELYYCLTSIRKFSPWISKIFLVTSRHCSELIDRNLLAGLDVNVVLHQDIFEGYEHALPTFNSRTIECMIHRVPGLAEHYVYFNDDFILLNDVRKSDFFSDAGEVVLRGSWKQLARFGRFRTFASALSSRSAHFLFNQPRSMAVLAQMRAAQIAGFEAWYLEEPHVPKPARKSTIGKFFAENPNILEENIRYRFRDMRQFVPLPLSNHLEIRAGSWVHSPSKDDIYICFNRERLDALEEKIQAVERGEGRFLCLQGFEGAGQDHRRRLESILTFRLKL